MNLKDILIRRMADLDIDQDEVARRSGISQAAISKMVVGKTKNTKFPAKIARAILVEPHIFMAATEGTLTTRQLNESLKEPDITKQSKDSATGQGDDDQNIIDAVAEIMGEGVSAPTRNVLLDIAEKAKNRTLTEGDILLIGEIAKKI